ncbi:MAG TPA: trehalose-phosphatase [Thermoanaerobaculia bacterium]|nr:trehalose-phosphatase [Thermoanaerobaculia bacterium]
MNALPSALANWEEIARRLAGRRPALFLDYDGTLSPIAPRPELAVLPEATREVVTRLAERGPVAILSGRGRDDVAALVGLGNVFYAGSHGFDITGPPLAEGGPPLRHEVGDGIPEQVERAAAALLQELAGIAGVLVEPKRFAVAVHYRLAADADLPRIEQAVDRVLAASPGLRKGLGKKVFELRPDLDWDKGRALLWLLETLGLGEDGGLPLYLPLYLGDDVTDEDAFRALEGRGIGVLVAEEPRPTAASYSLRDPDEVRQLLEKLLASTFFTSP